MRVKRKEFRKENRMWMQKRHEQGNRKVSEKKIRQDTKKGHEEETLPTAKIKTEVAKKKSKAYTR